MINNIVQDELRNLYFAVRTYELFGTRSPYAGVTDYSPSFELLEKIVSGEKNYVFWEPNELIYD
ncbi:MAG: hypothetical protein MJ252_22340, partial [archaeon]|nr:hypothetical protein [archaeon]